MEFVRFRVPCRYDELWEASRQEREVVVGIKSQTLTLLEPDHHTSPTHLSPILVVTVSYDSTIQFTQYSPPGLQMNEATFRRHLKIIEI
jgi:hypothetical protein